MMLSIALLSTCENETCKFTCSTSEWEHAPKRRSHPQQKSTDKQHAKNSAIVSVGFEAVPLLEIQVIDIPNHLNASHVLRPAYHFAALHARRAFDHFRGLPKSPLVRMMIYTRLAWCSLSLQALRVGAPILPVGHL